MPQLVENISLRLAVLEATWTGAGVLVALLAEREERDHQQADRGEEPEEDEGALAHRARKPTVGSRGSLRGVAPVPGAHPPQLALAAARLAAGRPRARG